MTLSFSCLVNTSCSCTIQSITMHALCTRTLHFSCHLVHYCIVAVFRHFCYATARCKIAIAGSAATSRRTHTSSHTYACHCVCICCVCCVCLHFHSCLFCVCVSYDPCKHVCTRTCVSPNTWLHRVPHVRLVIPQHFGRFRPSVSLRRSSSSLPEPLLCFSPVVQFQCRCN